MRCQYVTDIEIQEYLENQKILDIKKLTHIQNCETCQSTILDYQNLISELNKEPHWKLSQDFTDQILVNLPVKQKGFLKELGQETIFGVLGGLLAVGALFYYLKPKTIIEMFQNITLPNINWTAFFTPLKSIFSIRLANSHLLFFALITLVGIMILDRIFLHPRFTRFSKPYLKTY